MRHVLGYIYAAEESVSRHGVNKSSMYSVRAVKGKRAKITPPNSKTNEKLKREESEKSKQREH